MNCLLVGVKIALSGMAGRHGRHVLRSNSRQRVSANLPIAPEGRSPLILLPRTLGFASIMGIIEDTKLVGQQYSWLTTCGKSCDSLQHLQPVSPSCSLSCYVWPSHVVLRPQTNDHTSLVWEFPTNRLIQRLPIGKYLSFWYVSRPLVVSDCLTLSFYKVSRLGALSSRVPPYARTSQVL